MYIVNIKIIHYICKTLIAITYHKSETKSGCSPESYSFGINYECPAWVSMIGIRKRELIVYDGIVQQPFRGDAISSHKYYDETNVDRVYQIARFLYNTEQGLLRLPAHF